MADRKVLNKYYPPDFDPSRLTKTVKPKNNQVMVRLMLPMSIQCQTCGEYIHKGKKFNGRKEEAVGEEYLGIKVWRFYLKCTTCLAEITFKTDPKRNDYTVERGASRNFEPWKQVSAEEKLEAAKRAREEAGDSMKVLENRTEQSKREMELQDAIEEVKELNARAQALTTDQLIDIHAGAAARWEEAQIEQMAAEAFARKGKAVLPPGGAAASDSAGAGISSAAVPASAATSGSAASSSSLPVVKRLPDAVDLASTVFLPQGAAELDQLEVPDSPTSVSVDGGEYAAAAAANGTGSLPVPVPVPAAVAAAPSIAAPAPLAGLVLVKKRKANDDPEREKKKQAKKEKKAAEKAAASANPAPAAAAPAAGGLGGLLGNYADDSD